MADGPFRVRVAPGVPEAGLRRLADAGLLVEPGPIRASGVQGLLCLLTDRIDAAFLESAQGLQIVANMAVGTDNIDLEAASRLGIAVSNTPDVLTEATADLAFGLLLAAARRLPWGDRFVRAGAFTGWAPGLGVGVDVAGRTLGVVGAGRIGKAMAARASGFRMEVLVHDLVGGVGLDELLELSDFVSLHVPLTPETHHLIGPAELRRMRPHAILVNTSRGPVIDEQALVRALRERWIQAAALDVYEREPALAPGLRDLSNVVLAPHLGSATVATRDLMATTAADNLIACARGQPLPTAVVPVPADPG